MNLIFVQIFKRFLDQYVEMSKQGAFSNQSKHFDTTELKESQEEMQCLVQEYEAISGTNSMQAYTELK